jgi:transcriptional regulator with XRE-family HTH domain
MGDLGSYLRQQREALRESDSRFSIRQVAARIGVQPSYLSKVERSQEGPPSENTLRRLAKELGEDVDMLLAMGGKISSDLAQIIRKRPMLFAELLRDLKDMPDHAVLRIVREVRDGKW